MTSHRAPSFRCVKKNNGDYGYVVKYNEFVVVSRWYETRAKRLNTIFAKNPADINGQRIWKRCISDFSAADKMLCLYQQGKLTLE